MTHDDGRPPYRGPERPGRPAGPPPHRATRPGAGSAGHGSAGQGSAGQGSPGHGSAGGGRYGAGGRGPVDPAGPPYRVPPAGGPGYGDGSADGYDGDLPAGLYGGGYGGQPGDAAAARRALQAGGDGPYGPGGPGGPTGPGGPGGPGDPTGPGGPDRSRRARRRKKGRARRIVKIGGLVAVVLTILGISTVGVLYARTEVPNPEALPTNQVATIYYSDGKTPLARIGSQNRSNVPLDRVPAHVRWAVLAAENRSFYTDPGISPRGIARAAWNNVRGGELQGGSTITQQYVKNAFTSGDRTFARKSKELFVTIKLDRQYSKDQILEWYLNRIYFGRGAYGIQAAAGVYFGKSVDKLTTSEGAVLAASIRSPALYDPETHPQAARDRWRFVLNGMVTMGKVTAADVAAAKYPKVRVKTNGTLDDVSRTPVGHIVEQIKDELAGAKFDEGRLNAEGLRVVTTLNQQAQKAAVAAVNETFADQKQDPPLRQALVAIEPRTGKVLAYYGGADGTKLDYATQAWRQPGSSFKPIVLATALERTLSAETPDEDKVSLYKTYDGSSPRTFPGLSKPVRNSDGAQCNPCSVLDAMRRSINTVFYQMAIDAGPENVAAVAHRLGVATKQQDGTPTLQQGGRTAAGIGIGQYEVRPIDQATAFATLAAGGELHPTHFVSQVLDSAGNVVYEHRGSARRAVDPKVANDVTYAMKPVAEFSHDPLQDGRESAAKTGTQQFPGALNENQDAWMVGYTPQVSTAVWVGKDLPAKLRTNQGKRVYGSGLPGKTWQRFMDSFLAGRDELELTDDVQVNPQLKPTPTPTPTTAAPTTTPPPTTTAPPTTVPPTTPPPTTTAPPTTTPDPTASTSPPVPPVLPPPRTKRP